MNIELYEFGLDNNLDEVVTLLRSAIGTSLSKKDKDIKISEAIGIIDAIRTMVYISKPEEDKEVFLKKEE